MKIGVVLALILTVLALALFSRRGVEDRVVNYPSSGVDIIAFGDSLVAGVGSQMGGGFVSMLEQDLGRPIINLGISGNTTEDALNRIEILDQYKPRVVIVLLGGNDFLRKKPEEEIFSNLEKIVSEIQSRGAVVVLLGVRSGVLSNRYDNAFEDLSERLGTFYVRDVLDDIFGREGLMADALHPNDSGYKIIAERVQPTLLEALR